MRAYLKDVAFAGEMFFLAILGRASDFKVEEKETLYATGMTEGEAKYLRSQGFDPDEVLICEAHCRQGKWVLAEEFFKDILDTAGGE